MADLSVFGRLKSKEDYDREEQAFQLARQEKLSGLQNDRVSRETAQRQNMYPDIDKLGEVAIFKAAQGMELSPQETAAARFVNAKTMGIGFDPATQNIYQKQPLSERLGIDLSGGPVRQSNAVQPMPDDQIDNLFPTPAGGRTAPPPAPRTFSADNPADAPPAKNEYDQAYEAALEAAKGNAKLTQEITTNYLKSKMEFNENQAKAAGFAERMRVSNPIISDTNKQKAGQSMAQKALDAIPLLGNYVVSDDYQSFNQAQRDFINAQLRRESGAVISPEEFANARLQYFPQPGDSDSVVAQKAQNRQSAVDAMARSAGPAYKPTSVKPITDIGKIPMSAIKELRVAVESGDNAAIEEFDQVFGAGAAKKVIK